MSGMQQSRAGSPKPDWTRTVLSQIGKVVRGASPPPAGDPRYFNGDFMPWLTVAALTNIPDSQLIVVETAGKLTEAGAQFSRTLMAGTVIIANSGATLGVAKVLGVTCCANDGIAALLDLRADVEPRYVVHQINSQTDRLRKVVATGNGQPNLNTGLIGAMEIDLPCRAEQSAISDVLDASNALIDSLEQLLTKKRQIKHGAMQELLTGKRRLSGFSTTWKRMRLERVLRFQAGFPFPSHAFCSQERGLRLIRNRDLKSDDDIVHFDGSFDSQYVVKKGDVLVGMDGDFMPCLWAGEDALLNQRVGRVRPLAGLDLTFAHYFLIDKLKAIEAATGSTTVKHLSHGDVEGIEAAVPELAEQIEIGAILHEVDNNISALESRLTKARALKQAMAQALLTGRIRIPFSPQEPAVPAPPPKGVGALGSGPARTQEPTA